MYIDCVGMIRSGSTLQYNMIAEILELKGLGKRLGWKHYKEFHKIKEKHVIDKYNVFKNHFLTDEIETELKQVDGSILMYVYRDIRDVCVSIMDKENKTFELVFNSKALHKAIEQYYKVRNSSLKKHVQSYEVMFFNTKREIKEIARFLDFGLTAEEIEIIYDKISFEFQKERIKKYKENNEYISRGKQSFNANTLLHLNHIKDGSIGKYRQRLSSLQIKKLEDEFGEWLQEQGYKLENITKEQEPLRKYYSQHGEDYLLWKFFDFKKDGFFVEVGAFDGVHLSNTYSFELEGWKGICVEPGQYFENCKNNRPNSICVNSACVSSDDIKDITFYEEELGLLSSLDMSNEKKEDIEKRYKNRKLPFLGHKEKIVKAQTLNNILEENDVSEIDCITIDVEGAEIEVLKGFDIEKYKPKVVILEANNEKYKKELIDYMTVQNDYIFVREVSVNLVFVSNKDDFNKMQKIEINCTIEKQLHPLGKKYTLKSFLDDESIDLHMESAFNNGLILIYQVGKVGSSTIYKSLQNYFSKDKLYHVHNIEYADELLKRDLSIGVTGSNNHFKDGIKVKEILKNNEDIRPKIIVGVREPVSRWVSDVFENIYGRYEKNLIGRLGEIKLKETIDFIDRTLNIEPQKNWFDDELKAVFGVDVFENVFDKQKGFTIISSEKADVFVYRVENLKYLENEIGKFVGLQSFKLTNQNISENKKYAESYDFVKKHLRISKETLNDVFSTKFFTHFYDDSFKQQMIKKYSDSIEPPSNLREIELEYGLTSLLNEKVQRDQEIQKKNQELVKRDQEIQKKNQELVKRDQEIQKKNQEFVKRDQEVQKKNQELAKRDQEIQKKNQELAKRDQELKKRNKEIQSIYSSKTYRLGKAISYPYRVLKNVGLRK